MLFWMIVKVAFKSLMANKLRSVLAMLGIIIGVGAVIAMLAIGTGASSEILDRISAMGTNLLLVRPGFRGTGGVISGTQLDLTLEDAQRIVQSVRGIRAFAPRSQRKQASQVHESERVHQRHGHIDNVSADPRFRDRQGPDVQRVRRRPLGPRGGDGPGDGQDPLRQVRPARPADQDQRPEFHRHRRA